MIRDFLRELNELARVNGLSDEARRALVEKYERRYGLALEAGFSAEEAIEKFGSPEKIVKDAFAADNGAKNYDFNANFATALERGAQNFAQGGTQNFAQSEYEANEKGVNSNKNSADDADSTVNSNTDSTANENKNESSKSGRLNEFSVSVFNSDVIIIATDEPGVKIKVNGKVDYDSENNENGFSFSEIASSKKRRIFGVNDNNGGEVRIYVNERLGFNSVAISSGGCGDVKLKFDFKTKNFRINAVSGDVIGSNVVAERSASINVVSGDVSFKRFVAPSLTISTVSGDVIIKDVTAQTARMSSISGDVIVNGEIGAYKTSSISGEVTVNAKRACETVEEMINRNLKGVGKNLNDLGEELKTQFRDDEGDDDDED